MQHLLALDAARSVHRVLVLMQRRKSERLFGAKLGTEDTHVPATDDLALLRLEGRVERAEDGPVLLLRDMLQKVHTVGTEINGSDE